MGQRGILHLNMGGSNYYWKNFYFVNNRNYNWFYQNIFLKTFCNYFFIWVTYANKFIIKFISSVSASSLTLKYYHCFYKLRVVRLKFMFIWFLRNIIFRYFQWLVIYVEYYRRGRRPINRFKVFKKLRRLIELGGGRRCK